VDVGAVLVREENKKNILTYFIGYVLIGPKLKYLNIEKLVLAQIILARKLRAYLEPYSIKILMDQPLNKVMSKCACSRRMFF